MTSRLDSKEVTPDINKFPKPLACNSLYIVVNTLGRKIRKLANEWEKLTKKLTCDPQQKAEDEASNSKKAHFQTLFELLCFER